MSGEDYFLKDLEIAMYVLVPIAATLLIVGCIYQCCCYNEVSTIGNDNTYSI